MQLLALVIKADIAQIYTMDIHINAVSDISVVILLSFTVFFNLEHN